MYTIIQCKRRAPSANRTKPMLFSIKMHFFIYLSFCSVRRMLRFDYSLSPFPSLLPRRISLYCFHFISILFILNWSSVSTYSVRTECVCVCDAIVQSAMQCFPFTVSLFIFFFHFFRFLLLILCVCLVVVVDFITTTYGCCCCYDCHCAASCMYPSICTSQTFAK